MSTPNQRDEKPSFFSNKRLLIIFVLIWVAGLILGGVAKHYTVKPDPAVTKITFADFKNNYTQPGKVSLLVDVNNSFIEGYFTKMSIPEKFDIARPDFYFKLDSLSQVSAYVRDTLDRLRWDKIPMRFEARTNNEMKILSGTFIAIFLLCTYIMGVLIIRIVKKFFFQKAEL